jgi:hypothetical protein
MSDYVATFSLTSTRTTLHAATCNMVTRRRDTGMPVRTPLPNYPTAEAAVAAYRASEELDARGYPPTEICPCARLVPPGAKPLTARMKYVLVMLTRRGAYATDTLTGAPTLTVDRATYRVERSTLVALLNRGLVKVVGHDAGYTYEITPDGKRASHA